MTTLINEKPRFGLEGERLFCYLTSRYYDVTPGLMLEVDAGVWLLDKVAALIQGGASIETAFYRRDETLELRGVMGQVLELQAANADLGAKLAAAMEEIKRLSTPENEKQADKVEQAAADFNAATPAPVAGDKVEQAKQDFLAEPSGAFDAAAAAMAAKPEDYRRGDGVALNSAIHPGAPTDVELDQDGQPKVDETLPEAQLSPDSLETIEVSIEKAMEAQEAPPKGD